MTVVAAYDESSVPLASLPLTFSTADTKALLGVGISGSGVGALRKHAGGMFLASDLGGYAAVSLSKNYPNAPVSAIIEETGVFTWKAGEKTHGMSQSS